jgi:intracellular sulfur oxidation DsrE/DsrF family protein
MGDRRAPTIGRRAFLSGAAAVAAAISSCTSRDADPARSRPSPKVLTRADYDYATMMSRLRSEESHKQVFLAAAQYRSFLGVIHVVQVDVRELYSKMQLAMNSYDFSLGPGRGRLATLGVLINDSVILGLNDVVWEKYAIGKRYNLAKTNVYYGATSSLDPNVSPNDPNGLYQDWSAQAVLKRGGSFMVCHNALSGLANTLASSRLKCDAALAEMSANLLPGFLLVPSGLTAVQLAQENGWKLFPPA